MFAWDAKPERVDELASDIRRSLRQESRCQESSSAPELSTRDPAHCLIKSDGFKVAACREILKGSDADVTRRDAGQHGSRYLPVAINGFTGRDGRQRPCGRNSERMHRFANEIFAQDRPQCGAAVSAPRERRSSRALQLDIAPLAVAVQNLAKEDCAAVAKLRNEIAELMPGVGHRDRLCARRHDVAGKHGRQLVRFEPSRIDRQFRGERFR